MKWDDLGEEGRGQERRAETGRGKAFRPSKELGFYSRSFGEFLGRILNKREV